MRLDSKARKSECCSRYCSRQISLYNRDDGVARGTRRARGSEADIGVLEQPLSSSDDVVIAFHFIFACLKALLMTESHPAALSDDQRAVYDRQLRVWGLETQHRLSAARVLVIGNDGLAAEVRHIHVVLIVPF